MQENLLSLWNRPVPRYTSYPTAPKFDILDESHLRKALSTFDETKKPLSLYIHIPFCKTMCLFCGCSVILNRSPEKQSTYLSHLLKEISLVSNTRRAVSQLHLGGGTPTSLTAPEFEQLLSHLHLHFNILPDAEISIEVDPRTVYADKGEKLSLLKKLGFNRISFGVQDLDPTVQEAVRRRQSEEMTVSTYMKARELGFSAINIDLIYGLPHQTVDRFSRTIERLIQLAPDRLALYSYAKVPWLKKHQLAIPDDTLPSTIEKFHIYKEARQRLVTSGYTAIGMDHFALPTDPLSLAYHTKTLTRNFQGYAVQMADDMIGLGLTSIGFLQNTYFQNTKHLDDYQSSLSQNRLPITKGLILSPDDLIRRQAILSLMCHFTIEKNTYGHLADLTSCIDDGLLIETPTHYIATPLGELFVRLIASRFDTYLNAGTYSNAV